MIIGITGTSGSGKTTVGRILAKREDAFVIDADSVAKELNKPDTSYMKAIRNDLGDEFFLEDGNLDRKKLADEIYSNNDSRNKLNSITFKYVVDRILELIKNDVDKNYIVIDAPLLFESGLQNFCDYTISLISEYETKIKRICNRDNITEEVAKRRLNIQHDDNYYIEKSDYVINNYNGCNLELEVERIINKIEQI